MKINCKILIILILISALWGSCSNSTEPADVENKLYVQINDTEGNPIEGAGLHFFVQTNPVVGMHITSPGNQFVVVSNDTGIIPADYYLYQNFPNPFNPQTTIRFSLPISGMVTLRILNTGDLSVIKTLVEHDLPAGFHSVIWDGTNEIGEYMTNNIYSYQLQTDGFEETKTLFLNMIDPEHIKSLNCVPLTRSNSEGRIEYDYDLFPIGEEVLKLDSNGNELGVFTIPDSLQLVFIKENYKPESKPVHIDPDKTLEFTIILEQE